MASCDGFDPDRKPRLRPGVVLAPADGGRWQARFGFDGVTFLEGEAWGRVLPWLEGLLDGTKSLSALEDAAEGRCGRDEVRACLGALEEHGLIVTADSPPASETSLPIAVCGKSLLAERTLRTLGEQGFAQAKLESSGLAPHGFAVVVETDWSIAELEAWNREAIASRREWMLVGAWTDRVLVGPIFVPRETACFECRSKRLASHRRHLEAWIELEKHLRREGVPGAMGPVAPAVTQLAAAWAALEAWHHLIGGETPRTRGRVMVYSPADARLSIEAVLRVPWCEACEE